MKTNKHIYERGYTYELKQVKMPWYIRWNFLFYSVINYGFYEERKYFVDFIDEKGNIDRVFVKEKKE